MTIKEIIDKCGALGVHERRVVTDDYGELVIYSKDIDKWHKLLADIFGPAIKSPESKPTKDALKLTKQYGGIWDNQTLFRRDFGDVVMMAMFYPWQDGVHTTLRIIFSKK